MERRPPNDLWQTQVAHPAFVSCVTAALYGIETCGGTKPDVLMSISIERWLLESLGVDEMRTVVSPDGTARRYTCKANHKVVCDITLPIDMPPEEKAKILRGAIRLQRHGDNTPR